MLYGIRIETFALFGGNARGRGERVREMPQGESTYANMGAGGFP